MPRSGGSLPIDTPDRRVGRLARALPVLCAAHCAAAPLLALTGSLLVPEPLEWTLMAGALGFSGITVALGRRVHGGRGPALLVVLGAALWIGAHAATGPFHWAGGLLGGATLFGALVRDTALRGRCRCTSCRAS